MLLSLMQSSLSSLLMTQNHISRSKCFVADISMEKNLRTLQGLKCFRLETSYSLELKRVDD